MNAHELANAAEELAEVVAKTATEHTFPTWAHTMNLANAVRSLAQSVKALAEESA